MRYRALIGRSDALRIAPQRARLIVIGARLPARAALGQHLVRDQQVDGPRLRIDTDRVAILDQRDRPALGSLRPDMADAEAARAARKTPVGDQRDLLAHAKAIERGSGRQHLAHPRPALRPFIADDDDLTLLDRPSLDRREGVLLAIEATRRPLELEPVHPRNLHDRAIWCQAAAQPDHTAGRGDRRLDVIDDLLVGVPRHLIDILAQRLAGHSHALAMEKAVFEHRLHQHVDAAGLVHVFGDIFTTGF